MTTISSDDQVTSLHFAISSMTNPDGLTRTCVATRKVFTGTLTFEVRCHETNNVVLSRQLDNFEVDAWAFGSWQQHREFSTVGREATVGTYLDKDQNVSYIRAYQVIDASDPAARRVAGYMVGGVRCQSVDPVEIAVPPFHDPKVVEFFCKELYTLIHGRPNDVLPITLVYAPPKPLSDLLKQTGTKRTQSFEAAMEWEPDMILAFPNARGEFHKKLIDDNISLPIMAIARLDKRVHAVIICDPTPINPWNVAELKAFQEGVLAAAKDLLDGKKVLFLCEGGKNRSRAAAIAAARLAKFDTSALLLPEDVSLMQVVDCVVARDAVSLAALAPFFPRREKRKR
jgi:hypothetical protein